MVHLEDPRSAGDMQLEEAVGRVGRQLDLAPPEAAVYVHLWSGGPAKVSDLAEAMDLHRNEVYRITERLEARGLVRTTLDRPARVAAVEPQVAFDTALTARLARVEALRRSRDEIATLVSQLDARPDAAATPARSTYKMLRGRRDIMRERGLVIETAGQELAWASTFPAGVRIAESMGQLETMRQRALAGVKCKILVPDSPENRQRLAALAATPNVEIRWTDAPGVVRFLIADERELLMFVVNDESLSLQADDEVAIHTTAAGFLHAQRVYFERTWANAPAFQPEERA